MSILSWLKTNHFPPISLDLNMRTWLFNILIHLSSIYLEYCVYYSQLTSSVLKIFFGGGTGIPKVYGFGMVY